MTIKELRAQTGLSQRDFAKKYNIPLRTLENWESSTHPADPQPYVINLLQRCILGDVKNKQIDIDNNISVKALREKTKLSKKDFAEKYYIPLRLITEWEAGRRNCKKYVLRMLALVVTYDERTRHYIQLTVDPTNKDTPQNIICGFDVYKDAQTALEEIQRAVKNGEYDRKWGLKTAEDRKKARRFLEIKPFQAHDFLN